MFWNTNRRPLAWQIAKITRQFDLDFVILAECAGSNLVEEVHRELDEGYDNRHSYTHVRSPLCRKLDLFTKLPADQLAPIVDGDSERWTVWQINLLAKQPFLLVVTHMISKMADTYGDVQTNEIGKLVRDILKAEEISNHRRTILVGDLNLDPFDTEVAGTSGLNAVMTKEIALKMHRQVQRQKYWYFYNPMWGLWGDTTPGPAGTYFYSQTPTQWHIYDQVLMRPELIDRFDFASLRILENDGDMPLLSQKAGRPNASDHLPLIFAFDL